MSAKTHLITAIVIWILFAGFPFPIETTKAADQPEEKIIQERLNSMTYLKQLGVAILLYASDNNERYPEKPGDLKNYLGDRLDWLLRNACYIKPAGEVRPDRLLAFDKTMILKGEGTVVLFNDAHVEFVKPEKLALLGIIGTECVSNESPDLNTEKKDNKNSRIVLKVVGPDGKSLTDAKIYQYYSAQDDIHPAVSYTSDNNGMVVLPEEKIFTYDWQSKNGVVLYGLFGNKLAGFLDVGTGDLGKKLEMKLTPACRVYGKIKSTELNNLNQKLDWSNIYVFYNNQQPLQYMGKQGNFEFLMPQGKYQTYAYAKSVYGKQEEVEIKSGQKELELNFDLPADRIAQLITKQAPELQEMKGWINSKPIKLADLRGKVILLDFWGTWCGPCVQVIPELIKLHEKYRDKGLVIIGIHDDSMNSVKDLEKELNKLSKERWDGEKIPYAIALDGGGRCKIEGTEKTASGATTAAYGIQAFPTMVLIDKQGKVISDFYPGPNNELLERLLAD